MSSIEGLVAGGIAGVVAEAALYPVDTIKTRMQASSLIVLYRALLCAVYRSLHTFLD